MSTPILTAAELDELRRYNTPTISNAIELFDIRPRHVGFLPHTIRCLLPNLGPIVGYAVTSRTLSRSARRLSTLCRRDAGPEDFRRLGP
jgi:4-hydroxy-4-methyl-2-oxoglutarate aldolase